MFSHHSPFYDYDDFFSPFDSMTTQQLQQQRRQQALEAERRRRAELQWRQRQMYEQEERRRRREEALRRQKEEEYLRRRMAMEEMEKKKQQRLQREAMKMNRGYYSNDHANYEDEGYPNMWGYHGNHNKSRHQRPTIVRGLDGRLYRIMPDDIVDYADINNTYEGNMKHQKNHALADNREERDDDDDGNGCNDGISFMKRVSPVHKSVKQSRPKAENKATRKDDIDESDNASTTDSSIESKNEAENTGVAFGVKKDVVKDKSETKTPLREKVNESRPMGALVVGVEDASDDEDDADLKSIWRNRVPSEGEWMEPVTYL